MIELSEWQQSSLDRFGEVQRERVAPAEPRFSYGFWTCAYRVADFPVMEALPMLDLLTRVQGRETGWPPWRVPTREGIRPYPYRGVIECWLGEQGSVASDSDFWRASGHGLLFLARGYQDDDGREDMPAPGAVMDPDLPMWRVGECLRHAARLASTVGSGSEVQFSFAWRGLAGRRLTSWADERERWHRLPQGPARQPDAQSSVLATAAEIETRLAEVVERAMGPFWDAFSFWRPATIVVQQQMERLTSKAVV